MSESLTFRCAGCGARNRVPAGRVHAGPKCGRCKAPLGASPVEVSDDELALLIRECELPVLVDFWAPWCGPCRAVAPHLAALAERNAGRLLVAKVNTDQHSRTAQALQVRAIPTLAIWKDGALLKRRPGALQGPQLDAFVAEAL